MISLINDKIEKKSKIEIFTLTRKHTKELLILYFRFYNWREISKIRAGTEEI